MIANALVAGLNHRALKYTLRSMPLNSATGATTSGGDVKLATQIWTKPRGEWSEKSFDKTMVEICLLGVHITPECGEAFALDLFLVDKGKEIKVATLCAFENWLNTFRFELVIKPTSHLVARSKANYGASIVLVYKEQ